MKFMKTLLICVCFLMSLVTFSNGAVIKVCGRSEQQNDEVELGFETTEVIPDVDNMSSQGVGFQINVY